jgi:hypothetical protein
MLRFPFCALNSGRDFVPCLFDERKAFEVGSGGLKAPSGCVAQQSEA